LNILSLTYEYPPIGGGGSVVAAALNQQLVADGHRVRVVTSTMRGLLKEEVINAVEVHRAACWRRNRHFTTAPELFTTLLPAYRLASEQIERERPDVIHTHFAMPSGLIAWRLSQRYGIPYVVTAHGSDIPGYNPDRFMLLHRLLKPVWRRIMSNAAAITSPSEFLARLLRKHLEVPVYIVPNGYQPDAGAPQVKRNLALVVARLFPRKGVQHFIEAVSGMDNDWEYVIAGDGPYMQPLDELARRLNAPVKFAGFVGKPKLLELYEQAEVFVFPSIQENFPMVLLEAMDAGCAVITTDAEGCAEVVGDAGIVIERANALQIRRALAQLTQDAGLRRTLAARAQERVQQFRWPRIASLYGKVFAAVLRREIADVQRIGDFGSGPAPRNGSERVA
jgi:glycosyltransferase involved in cell wall biosynthesis